MILKNVDDLNFWISFTSKYHFDEKIFKYQRSVIFPLPNKITTWSEETDYLTTTFLIDDYTVVMLETKW